MKIYVTHSREFDFKKDLYTPLRKSNLNTEYKITLPHEQSDNPFNAKEHLKENDLIIAEVSYPSTGQGIELGFAHLYGIPIVCIHKEGNKISSSLHVVSKVFLTYKDTADMITQITVVLKKLHS